LQGEKDGAFVWYIANELAADPPTGSSRWEQYLQFYSFMEGFNHNMGGAASSHGAAKLTLMSGEWIGPHVSAKTGMYTLLSNEGAQGLPNDQLFFSHLRGAAKQHAAAIWADISLYGVQGSKCYDCDHDPVTPSADEACCPYEGVAGPVCGTSLILLKRLFYQAMMYNAWIVGSDDSGMFISSGPGGGAYRNGTGSGPPADGSSSYYNRTLDPIGRVMQDAHDFSVRVGGRPMENPGLGVMLTPIALITDPMQGFLPPRTNYNPATFQTWGNRPWERSDYFTHACFDMLYQGYADCAYFLDEKGYTSPTPFGDSADVLTSDVMPWVLDRYSIALVVSDLEVGLLEVREKLRRFVLGGGTLVITAGNLIKLPANPADEADPGGLFGVWGFSDRRTCMTKHAANTTVTVSENGSSTAVQEPLGWTSCKLEVPENATAIAVHNSPLTSVTPLAMSVDVLGGGRLVVLYAQSGVTDEPAMQPSELKVGRGESLRTPFPMLRHIRQVLERELRRHVLFEAGDGLAHITNMRPDGSFVVAVSNPGVRPLHLTLRPVAAGAFRSTEELEIGRGEADLLGYLPCGAPDFGVNDSWITGNNSGSAAAGMIRGGDVRIFVVKTQASPSITTVRKASPPPLPVGVGLPIRSAISLRQEIIRRPSFTQHFDAVVMDSDWLGCSSVGTSMPEQWGCSPAHAPTLVTDRFWLSRNGPGPRGLRVFVDISKLIAAYTACQISENPGALENDAPPPDSLAQTQRVLRRAIQSAAEGGAHNVIFRTHMMTLQDSESDDPTNSTKMKAQFVSSVRWMCDVAAKANVTLHMRQQAPPFTAGDGPLAAGDGPLDGNLSEAFDFVRKVGRPNLRVALATAAMATNSPMFTATEVAALVSANKPLVGALLASASETTFMGDRKSTHARLATASPTMSKALASYTRAVSKAVGGFGRVPVLLDAVLEGQDEEYAEAVALRRLQSDDELDRSHSPVGLKTDESESPSLQSGDAELRVLFAETLKRVSRLEDKVEQLEGALDDATASVAAQATHLTQRVDACEVLLDRVDRTSVAIVRAQPKTQRIAARRRQMPARTGKSSRRWLMPPWPPAARLDLAMGGVCRRPPPKLPVAMSIETFRRTKLPARFDLQMFVKISEAFVAERRPVQPKILECQ
jgi:hypothetical protein